MVVVDAQYVESYALDLAVQRKSGNNPSGNFTVVDVNGNLMFKIKDTRFSFHDRHILYDATDKPVLTFKKKLRSYHGRWQAFKGESATHKDMLFSVKKNAAPKHETELDVFLVENKEETTSDCKVMGDWETKSCNVYAQDGSTILAEVHDKQNITNVEAGKDTFGVTVYPEVDYVFIVALVVILTEIKSYDNSGKKKKKKKKTKKDSSSSSDENHKKVEEKKDDVKEEMELFEVKSQKEEDDDHDHDRDHDNDDDDDDDDDGEEEDDDSDEDDDDYDDGHYDEEPKFDVYDDDDDNDDDIESSSSSSSSSSDNPSPKVPSPKVSSPQAPSPKSDEDESPKSDK